MKRVLLGIMALGVAMSAAADSKVVHPDSTGFKFTDTKVIKCTPVKDQHKSGTCWCYSTNTYFEAEILRVSGKEIHLSEAFVVNHCYRDKADKFVRMDGKINFAQGGGFPDVPYVWDKYGMMPNEAYTGLTYGDKKFSHNEMLECMKGYVEVIQENKTGKLTPAWKEGFNGIVDAYMGKMPETFVYEGKTYTPKQWAEALPIKMEDYVAITSFSHHPFYEPFMLEIADNWLWASYQNVPIDEMLEVCNYAVDHGYAVAWAADISEPCFKFRKGYAVWPVNKDVPDLKGSDMERWLQLSDKDRETEKWDIKGPVEEENVTQERRQQMFDAKETTDDHGMVIVGKAVDQKGNRYFKVQNSWDTNQLYGGYFYVSEAYFKAKTIDITVHKDAVPAHIAKKIVK
ncbi:MAG: aminopeptidase [Muribaculaceae bacterium]|nr:aminopeptidase [Muribaculaceae bacterium]